MSKPVLFVSFRPLERAENMRAIYNAYKGDKVHVLSSDLNFRGEVLSGKYDLMVTDDFPSVTPGKCIVIWHGIHGGKTIALDQPGHPYFSKETADMITYIVSAGTGMIPMWSRCTGLPCSHILPLGLPRTDEYVHYTHVTHDRKIYLFAPTFRDKNDTPFPDIDWAYIDSQLTDDEMFFIKAHPWQEERGIDQVTHGVSNEQYKHICVLNPSIGSAEWLYLSDVVITDYSSIMFDAYLLNKPVVLFEKSHGYTETRGMCFNYPEDYSPFFVRTEQGLLTNIRFRAKHQYLAPAEERIKHAVSDMCDGHACERLCKLIDELKG